MWEAGRRSTSGNSTEDQSGSGEGRNGYPVGEFSTLCWVVFERFVDRDDPKELREQRTHAGDDSESRDRGDTGGDEESGGPALGGNEVGNIEPVGDEVGDLEEIMLLEEDDEAEVSSTIGQLDGNVTGQVESEIDPIPARESEVMFSANIRGHLTDIHPFYQIL